MIHLPVVTSMLSRRLPSKTCVPLPAGAQRRLQTGRALGLLALLFVLMPAPRVALAAAGNSPAGLDQTIVGMGNSQSGAPAQTAAPAAPAQAVAASPERATAQTNYEANLKSNVFGANLFTGAFVQQGATQFNPDYAIAIGDKIQIHLWGAYEFNAPLTVDPLGNIFLPEVGPLHVLGVHNQDLQQVVASAVGKIFSSNVNSYASLAAAQPVRIFVGGFVKRPGMYGGTSMDSLLHFLDLAGGIDLDRGSFLDVQVKRGEQVRATVNLYDFLLEGRMPLIQLADGDVIFVSPRRNTLTVTGLAENAKCFEFSDAARTVADIIKLAKPLATVTNFRIVRNTGKTQNTEYYPLAEAGGITLQNGDELAFTSDKQQGTITVRVEGEHEGDQEYTVPTGTRLGEILKGVRLNDRSDMADLQLFRLSVKDRQRQMLQASIKNLQDEVLTARTNTAEEAPMRKEDADLVMQWVESVKNVEPTGQVAIAQNVKRDDLVLENGDVLRIPAKDSVVLVSGEVLFPNTVAFDPALKLEDYISHAGGYTQGADVSRIIVAHLDGSFKDVSDEGGLFSSASHTTIRPGDEILVLPQADRKYRQFWKDIMTVAYQIAVTARIVTKF